MTTTKRGTLPWPGRGRGLAIVTAVIAGLLVWEFALGSIFPLLQATLMRVATEPMQPPGISTRQSEGSRTTHSRTKLRSRR